MFSTRDLGNFDITDAPGPVVDASSTTPVTCFGGTDGDISVTIISGTAPISYSLNGSPSQPTNAFSNLSAGNYDVTISTQN